MQRKLASLHLNSVINITFSTKLKKFLNSETEQFKKTRLLLRKNKVSTNYYIKIESLNKTLVQYLTIKQFLNNYILQRKYK